MGAIIKNSNELAGVSWKNPASRAWMKFSKVTLPDIATHATPYVESCEIFSRNLKQRLKTLYSIWKDTLA
jgi:hypothetical protein